MRAEEFLAMPPIRYSDWFGGGDSHQDYRDAVGDGRPPDEVLIERNMLLLIWPDKIVCTGYDGNEYQQSFEFQRQPKTA